MAYFYACLYRGISKLPWWCIELLSRVGAFMLYHILRYRRKVVEHNIQRSFPDLREAKRNRLAKDFYHHLVYQMLSSPKMLYISPKDLRVHHLQVQGIETLQMAMEQTGAKLFIALLGHIGNWELMSAGNLYFQDIGVRLEQLYRPLSNVALDGIQKAMRSHNGAVTTPKAEVGRRIVQLLRDPEAEPTLIAFIADQTPSQGHVGLWTTFLNQQTAFLNGAERLARKYNLPVFYYDVERVSNKHYIGRLVPITMNAKATQEGEITLEYVRLLEQTIRRDPAIWLWSHKRWKLIPPDVTDAN